MKMTGIFLSMLLLVACTASLPEEELSYPAEELMENSFSGFYREVGSTVDPRMEPMGLPVDPTKVINLEGVLSYVRVLSAPDVLLENGFAVLPMNYPTDNPMGEFPHPFSHVIVLPAQ